MDFYKDLAKNAEERYTWYKKELENLFKERTAFPPDDELVIWYKEHLREMKNSAEAWMKEIQEQYKYERDGLNPPFYYKR